MEGRYSPPSTFNKLQIELALVDGMICCLNGQRVVTRITAGGDKDRSVGRVKHRLIPVPRSRCQPHRHITDGFAAPKHHAGQRVVVLREKRYGRTGGTLRFV